jgi:hypothetical protein
MSQVITIGLDIAKSVFHAYGADERGSRVFSRKPSPLVRVTEPTRHKFGAHRSPLKTRQASYRRSSFRQQQG